MLSKKYNTKKHLMHKYKERTNFKKTSLLITNSEDIFISFSLIHHHVCVWYQYDDIWLHSHMFSVVLISFEFTSIAILLLAYISFCKCCLNTPGLALVSPKIINHQSIPYHHVPIFNRTGSSVLFNTVDIFKVRIVFNGYSGILEMTPGFRYLLVCWS